MEVKGLEKRIWMNSQYVDYENIANQYEDNTQEFVTSSMP